MDLLNNLDFQFAMTLAVMVLLFSLFFYSALRKQKQGTTKVEQSLKNQEILIYQANLVLVELRRSNYLLSELAGVELGDESYEDPKNAPNFSSASHAHSQHKLYVGNIDYTATENELASLFARFGKIEVVNIPINRYSGRPRGFGFISFSSQAEAQRALTLNGVEFKGRPIQVNFAKERETL